MKLLTILVTTALCAPTVSRAHSRAEYTLRVTAVGCVFSAKEELESCNIVTNPVNEKVSVKLERTNIKDWLHDSMETNQKFALHVPQLNRAIEVDASVSLGRDAGSRPAPAFPFSVSAAISVAPDPGIGHGFSTVNFSDPKTFGGFHAEGVRKRYPLPGGRSLDFSPQIDVTDLTFLD